MTFKILIYLFVQIVSTITAIMNQYTEEDAIPETPDPTGNTLGTEQKIISVHSDEDDSNVIEISTPGLKE